MVRAGVNCRPKCTYLYVVNHEQTPPGISTWMAYLCLVSSGAVVVVEITWPVFQGHSRLSVRTCTVTNFTVLLHGPNLQKQHTCVSMTKVEKRSRDTKVGSSTMRASSWHSFARSFYLLASGTTSVRADSFILERYKFSGDKPTPGDTTLPRMYAVCIMQWYATIINSIGEPNTRLLLHEVTTSTSNVLPLVHHTRLLCYISVGFRNQKRFGAIRPA